MPFGSKHNNESRFAEAKAWRDQGHMVYVQVLKAGAGAYKGGHWQDASLEIEAIEAAGWKLSDMAQMLLPGAAGVTTCVFRAAA